MVYLQNRTGGQPAYFPKNYGGEGAVAMTIRNTITQKEHNLGSMTDEGGSDMYYLLPVSLPEGIDDGEWEYTLTQDGIVVATGILKVGESAQAEQYNSEIEYEQYESE